MPAQLPPSLPAAASSTEADDALAHEDFEQDQDPLDIAAATWATRRRAGLDAHGQAELSAWLAADPRHAAALAGMDATFEHVRRTRPQALARPASRTAMASDRAARRPAAKPPRGPSWPPGSPRPAMARLGRQATAVAFVASLTSLSWIGWSHWQSLPTFEQAYATARGQQLDVRLPDASPRGSLLQLDTATQVDARLFRDHREVRLQDGQALFSVHADASRPFHVLAGGVRVTVVGTRFSVRHTAAGLDAGRTVVSVEEGRVTVQGTDASTDVIELSAGQAVVADAGGHLGPVQAVATDTVASWRDGRISFDQTPLAQAVAEFERYVDTGLVIRDPAVASLPVGGSYELRQLQRFVEALPQVLPVRLVRQGRETEIRARQNAVSPPN